MSVGKHPAFIIALFIAFVAPSPLSAGEFWEYDPISDIWTQLPNHPGDAIWAPGNFVIGCDVYFLLGQDNNSFTPILPISVYKYKLNEDCGCTDQNAYNYSSLALYDDGSCCFLAGCTDPMAINFDSTACYDDSSCVLAILGCTNPTASNFNPLANVNSFNGGPVENNIGAGSYFYNNQHLNFSSNEACRIISADVVEVAPAYDHAEVTSLAAATIVFELTNLFAKK